MPILKIERNYSDRGIVSFKAEGLKYAMGHVNTKTGKYCPVNLKEMLDLYQKAGFEFESDISAYAMSIIALAKFPQADMIDILEP